MSTVTPSYFSHGTAIANNAWGNYSFPVWMGQNSKANKNTRIVREIATRLRCKTSMDSAALRLSYLPTLSLALTRPLVDKDGIDPVIDVMDAYYLSRDDWDGLLDMSVLPRVSVDSKVKSKFTSTFVFSYVVLIGGHILLLLLERLLKAKRGMGVWMRI